MLHWEKLLCSDRLKKLGENESANSPSSDIKEGGREHRLEIERDYDRILFSTPVRRLADKTQVFPLEKNDSVRTRLTHSHEVSNLCRSIGTALVYSTKIFDGVANAQRNVPALLAAIGLAHDLGNPPFGHQGEAAIGGWFKKHFLGISPACITERMRAEFEKFEGNAQTLRVVTKLQLINNNRGLNLTLGTLAALMKYPVRADQIDKSKHPRKKFNYFESEDDIVAQVRAATGLIEGVRHPLTFIMEACDDIAYCVLDVEDSVKKGMVSIYDAIAWLSHKSQGESSERKALVQRVITRTERDITKYREFGLSPSELNDAAMQKLRVHSIAEMVNAVIRRAEAAMPEMLQGSYDLPILQDSDGALLRDALQDFAREHAYKHRSVLEKELKGYKVITSLMEIFWNSIESRRKNTSGPFDRYVYGRISENYRRVAENTAGTLPAYYCDCRLLADMVAGMTDGFATDLYQELLEYR